MKEVLDIIKKRLENHPTNSKMISTYGILFIEVGQYDAAVEILEKGLAHVNDDPELWNYLGLANWRKGNLRKALSAFQNAVSLNNKYPVVFKNIGSLYLSRYMRSNKAIDLKNAIQNFKKAVEVDPDLASAYNGLCSAYEKAGDLDAAIDSWEKAVELKPDFSLPLFNLGLHNLARGRRSKALEIFIKYKKIHYENMSKTEKKKLDTLIHRCKVKG